MAKREHAVLVLQGGGALGAYQAGVYEGIAETGLAPNWIAGVSIGAINAALIAGNPPERHGRRSGFRSTVTKRGGVPITRHRAGCATPPKAAIPCRAFFV